MTFLDRVQTSAVSKTLATWREIRRESRRVFLFIVLAGLLPWLTFTSFDIANYVVGAEQIISGQSVYEPQIRSPTSGRLVPAYPYLPSFAMLLALGIAPIFLLWETGVLPGLVYEAIARQIANAPGYIALIGIPVLAHYAFSSPTELDQIKREISEDWVFWGVLIVSLTPALWFQVLESGSDTFVALLTLLGIYAVMNDRWLVAGLLVGSATFKFTALPLAAVLALYSIRIGWKQFGAVAIGGVVSQIPNVLYYAIFPRDLLFVIEQRGKMSLYSGETRSVATAPFRAAGLEQWYIEVGFLFALVIFVGLGLAVTLRRKNLVLGFAVAYLATSYFAPVGEINASVLTVFLLFEGAANFQRRPARYLVAWLLAVELYSFLLPLRFIDYVSVVPFPWWDSAIQMVEFGTVIIVLVGLAYLSDHGRFRAP